MIIKPCDIILTSKENIFVKAMRFFQKDPVNYGHALIAAENGKAYSFDFELEYINLEEYLKEKEHYIVFRYKYMTAEKEFLMLNAINKLVNTPYGVGRLILMLLDNIFRTRFFSKLSNNKKDQVCSSVVAWAYYVAFKTKFNGVDWRSIDPDDIEDHCYYNQDWIIVTEV